MRAIDGDALMDKLSISQDCSICEHSNPPFCRWKPNKVDICEAISEAPTIEPQRNKGHWIRHPEQRNIFNGKTIECSECHEKYTVQYVEDEWFCRHCGADMREDGEADADVEP